MQLTEVPPELGQLTNLRALDLSSNQLTALPPELGQLANLEQLNLFRNRLTTLPPELGQLVNLIILYLGDNQLTALPPQLGQLQHLKYLYLDENPLKGCLPAAWRDQGIEIRPPEHPFTRVFSGRESVGACGSADPPRAWPGPGAARATVSGSVRSGRPRGGGRAGEAGRGVRRTEAAGVWRERWRSAMRVPRRQRG